MRTLLLTCCFAVACGGGGISPDDLADEIEDANCDRLVRCEGVEDRATCDASTSIVDSEFQTILAAIDDGTIKYDSGAAADCASAISRANCTFDGFHEADPCRDIFTGTVPTGGACFIDLQCANDGECAQNDPACDDELMCCVGTCMGSLTESPIGGPCGNDMNYCPNNSYCKRSGLAGTCTALVTNEGGTCDALDACANPMYCNLDFQTRTGTCKKAAGSGEACMRTDLLPCADSRDYCDPTMLKCVRSAPVGAACGNGIACVDYASCVGSTCLADLKPGAACVADAGADCAVSLECINGTCQLPPAGMACKLP